MIVLWFVHDALWFTFVVAIFLWLPMISWWCSEHRYHHRRHRCCCHRLRHHHHPCPCCSCRRQHYYHHNHRQSGHNNHLIVIINFRHTNTCENNNISHNHPLETCRIWTKCTAVHVSTTIVRTAVRDENCTCVHVSATIVHMAVRGEHSTYGSKITIKTIKSDDKPQKCHVRWRRRRKQQLRQWWESAFVQEP